MRIKQFVMPIALVVPILLALLLIRPPTTTEQFVASESNIEQAPKPVAVLSELKAYQTPHTTLSEENLDPASALTLLSEIALDQTQSPVVDHKLKQQLDNAMRMTGSDRSPSELDKFNDLVIQTFKPHTAQAINHIFHQYYTYKIAEEDYINSINLGKTDDASQKTAKALYKLRENYLGHELASKLFGDENIYQSNMAE